MATQHKTVYLIRHAQTQGNIDNNWLGAKSVDLLNGFGRKQAKDNVNTLLKLKVRADKIFASPTNRALEHAEILQRHLHLPIEKINSLTEINLGILEDRTGREGIKLVPDEVHNWETNLKTFHPPLGESALETSERFFEIVEFLVKHSSAKDFIIISHGVVLKLFLARILKASLEVGETEIKVPWTKHGSIIIVEYENSHFKFIRVVENKYSDSEAIAAYG